MRSPSAWASPRFRLVSIASTAFLTTLVNAWPAGGGRRPAGCRRWAVDAEVDAGMRDLVEEQRGAGDVMDILLAEHRLGHAREVGEFVDHSAEVADLPDDRVGQAPERFGSDATSVP